MNEKARSSENKLEVSIRANSVIVLIFSKNPVGFCEVNDMGMLW
jgi:hypothetical protein